MNGPRDQIAIRFLVLSAIVAMMMSQVMAQPNQPAPTASLQPLEDEEHAKRSLYEKFRENLNLDPLTAYKLAHEYLQRFPKETPQSRYIKSWVDHYILKENLTRRLKVQALIDEKRFDEAFVVGKAFLTSDPNDEGMLKILIHGGLAAFDNNPEGDLLEARNYAKRLLHLIESGKVKGEDNDRGFLNFAIGVFHLQSAPAEAASYFYKVLEFDAYKKDALTHSFLAHAINLAEYIPAGREWYKRFPTAQLRRSAAAAPIRRKMERAMDHIIDALARAVALAGPSATDAQQKVEWMNTLTRFWLFRNSGYDTGLCEYIDQVLLKPLPVNIYGKGEAH